MADDTIGLLNFQERINLQSRRIRARSLGFNLSFIPRDHGVPIDGELCLR